MSELEKLLLADDLFIDLIGQYADNYPEPPTEGETYETSTDAKRGYDHGLIIGYVIHAAPPGVEFKEIELTVKDQITLARYVHKIVDQRA